MRISAPKLTFEMISKVTFTQCVPRGEKGGGEDFIAAHFSRVGFSSFSSPFLHSSVNSRDSSSRHQKYFLYEDPLLLLASSCKSCQEA